MAKNKKKCSKCGRSLWIKRDFYKPTDCYCKDCIKAYMRIYQKRRYVKVEEGVMMRKGRLMLHEGHRVSIYWSSAMLDKMRKFYPTTKNEELCDYFGVSMRTLTRKARELGLKKDKDWMLAVSMEHLAQAYFINKIRKNSG